MALRDYLSSKIVTFLLPLAIYSCGTGNVNNGSQYCGSDMDCGAYQVCSLSGQCIQKGNCIVDNDCSGSLVCENGSCVQSGLDPNKIYGGTTPEMTWSQFQDSLKNGTLEEAVQYFDPSIRNKYQGRLRSLGLQTLSNQLNGTTLYNCDNGQKLKECNFGADEKVQFMLNQEKGQQIYKIKAL